MSNVVVIGAQWGDEGKGKIVDWLSERADVVARFQGGHNAGHTLVIDGKVYKLSLLPSGIVRGGKLSVVGNGVVVDPWALLDEIATITGQGVDISPDNFIIADNATFILPVHRELDGIRETAAGKGKIGTTGRGIGPAYEDKVGRRGIRVCDLVNLDALPEKIDRLLTHHNALRKGLGVDLADAGELFNDLKDLAPKILPFMGASWDVLSKAENDGKRILFEGAQGTMLDVDHGTYPYVTSSNTVAAQAATGTGLGPDSVGYVLGIAKAYTTRVGEGPFPTELFDEIGERIGERGHEFGTVTGRQRRCGWFDAVMVRQALINSGVSGIALTKLDVLDGLEELKVCTGYELDGEPLDRFPAARGAQARVKPVYKSFPGWSESTEGARKFDDLPENAINYIRALEDLIDTPIALVSTSPERNDTILITDPFGES